MKNIMKILGAGLAVACALILPAPAARAAASAEVDVPDTALRRALHDALGTAAGDPILDTQLMGLDGALDLSGRGIADLTGLEHLRDADALDLSDNKISEIPAAFCDMLKNSSVRALDLSGNNLSGLPAGISNSRLIVLDLSLNGFFSVPEGVTGIGSLEVLNLSGNKISRLPSALASMPSLAELWVEANRITALPGAFGDLSVDEFHCNYNFLDLTAETGNQAILNAMNADVLEYRDQLRPLTGLNVSYPVVGTAAFSWDPCEDLDFGGGVVARVTRTSILLSGTYIGEVTADQSAYTHEGLTAGRAYKFQFSWDYKIAGTPYSANYTKCYVTLETTPGETADPAAVGTAAPTQPPAATVTPAPSGTSEPAVRPTPDAAAPTAAPSAGPSSPAAAEAQAPASSEQAAGGVPIVVIVLLVVVIVLLLVALGIVSVYLFNRR